MKTERTGRQLLIELGVSPFNATMMIEQLFVAPATTDPKSPQLILMVGQIQRRLMEMGAQIRESGYLDVATANALTQVVGDRWMAMSWADVIRGVLRAKAHGFSFGEPDDEPVLYNPNPQTGVGLFDLPDVPGGLLTYGVAAFLLYRYFRRSR